METTFPTPITTRWQRPFFTIWTGQAFSLLGSSLAGFALVWWLTDTSGSATVLAGFFIRPVFHIEERRLS